MSAEHNIPARDIRFLEALPSIYLQRVGLRGGGESHNIIRNTTNPLNRNMGYVYELKQHSPDSCERMTTPLSDCFSESETGSDFLSEESDSSSGSIFRQNTEEATQALAAEWNRIERTLYDEEGEKTKHPQMIEECKQWRQLHPLIRVVGHGLPLPKRKISNRRSEDVELIAMHYTDYAEFSEADQRLSESSNDVTPMNSPRIPIQNTTEPKLSRQKVDFFPKYDKELLPDDFCSILQITPLQIQNPVSRRQNSSIIKSDIASSKWMRNYRPDSSLNCGRNSAKSFISLDTRNLVLSASERNKVLGNRVITARYGKKLQPLYTPELPPQEIFKLPSSMHSLGSRKVSLPPLMIDDKKKGQSPRRRSVSTAKTRGSELRNFNI